MTEESFGKSHMFWSPNRAYVDGIPIPRRTYRCKGTVKVTKSRGIAVKQAVTHQCKLVTDHPREACLCICGQEFNHREGASV